MKPKRFRLFMALNTIIPLVIGAAVYYLFCPDTYISQWLYKVMKLPIPETEILQTPFSEFISYYLQDALWAYSLTFIISIILGQTKVMLVTTTVVCILFEAMIEFFQLFKILPGVFDILDIVLMASATVIAVLLISINKYHLTMEEKENGKANI